MLLFDWGCDQRRVLGNVLLHVDLHVSERELQPGWRWLLQVNSQELEVAPFKFVVELNRIITKD